MVFPAGGGATGGTIGKMVWSFLLQATTNKIIEATKKCLELNSFLFIINSSFQYQITASKKTKYINKKYY
jgi:hypothetical protein